MQTILGANGQIEEELARELERNFTFDIRVASRKPKKKVNDTDELFAADLTEKTSFIPVERKSKVRVLMTEFQLPSKLTTDLFTIMIC